MAAETTALRDRLLARKRPSLSVPIATTDVTELSQAASLAEEEWRYALLAAGQGQPGRVVQTRKALDAALAAVNACYAHITVTALPGEEFEALVAQHPAREDEDEVWNDATFPRALFRACASDDLTDKEWDEFLDTQCSQAERDTLLSAAQQINVRAPNLAIPKG